MGLMDKFKNLFTDEEEIIDVSANDESSIGNILNYLFIIIRFVYTNSV